MPSVVDMYWMPGVPMEVRRDIYLPLIHIAHRRLCVFSKTCRCSAVSTIMVRFLTLSRLIAVFKLSGERLPQEHWICITVPPGPVDMVTKPSTPFEHRCLRCICGSRLITDHSFIWSDRRSSVGEDTMVYGFGDLHHSQEIDRYRFLAMAAYSV